MKVGTLVELQPEALEDLIPEERSQWERARGVVIRLEGDRAHVFWAQQQLICDHHTVSLQERAAVGYAIKPGQLTINRSLGSGEALVQTSRDRRIELNHTPIDARTAAQFINWLWSNRDLRAYRKPDVTFSKRKTVSRWGTAWPNEARFILYRHSVEVFLHELAHCLTPGEGHNGLFAMMLDAMFKEWTLFEKRS